MRLKIRAMTVGLALGLVSLADSALLAQPLGLGTSLQAGEKGSDVLATSNGRFVFGQVSDSSKDQFMLDTVTGRLWRISESGKLGTHLKSVLYCGEDGRCSPAPQDGPKSDSQLERR